MYSLEVKLVHSKLHLRPWENHLGSIHLPAPVLLSVFIAQSCLLLASGITAGHRIFAK